MALFQQVRLAFGTYLIGLILADQLLNIPFLAYFLPICLFIFICGKGAANIQSNFYTKANCYGKTKQKRIALTFDDGPDAVITPQVLALLKEHNLLATFFLIGHKIGGNEAIVQQIAAEGHLIGNHSFSHSVGFTLKWTKGVRDELIKTKELIFKITGKKVRYFRPPFGVTNPHIAKAAEQENYQVIGWNVRPYDAVTSDKDLILKRIKKNLQAGSIVLLHDIKPVILEVLEELIPYLKKEGFEVVSLEELI
jgi:peptidoglycan/xylan/chitin deacetylase (PgdA/CDA1 family)